MFNMSGSEIIVIVLLALVVLGPEKLPDAMRKAGKAVSELRRMGSAFQSEMHETMDEPMREMRDTANLLRGATDFKTTARRAVSGLTTTSSDDEPAADTKPTPPTPAAAAAATNPVSTSLEAAVAESSASDDAATANGDLATTSNGDAADAGHGATAPDDTAPTTPTTTTTTTPSSIERALRGDSTIDRATAGEDGTTSA